MPRPPPPLHLLGTSKVRYLSTHISYVLEFVPRSLRKLEMVRMLCFTLVDAYPHAAAHAHANALLMLFYARAQLSSC